jgi:hypothetical protein
VTWGGFLEGVSGAKPLKREKTDEGQEASLEFFFLFFFFRC